MGDPMNKSDFIARLANRLNEPKSKVEQFVNGFTDEVATVLKKGDDVNIVGWGKFKISKRQPRKGRNPRTGEVINIPAANQPQFVAGKTLKDSVN